MLEFHIIHNATEERNVIFGYNLSDAFRRNPSLNPNEWTCIISDYID
jgi:hypothetical protein